VGRIRLVLFGRSKIDESLDVDRDLYILQELQHAIAGSPRSSSDVLACCSWVGRTAGAVMVCVTAARMRLVYENPQDSTRCIGALTSKCNS
jgi:hypothetical protein